MGGGKRSLFPKAKNGRGKNAGQDDGLQLAIEGGGKGRAVDRGGQEGKKNNS